MMIRLPFQQLPPIDTAIVYGSILQTQSSLRPTPTLIDFIFVVDEDKISLDNWHAENYRLNPTHYGAFASALITRQQQSVIKRFPGLPVFFSPLAQLQFYDQNNNQIPQLTKYIVVSKKDLIADLNRWSEFYLAGRLQKPSLILNLGNEKLAKTVGDLTLLSSSINPRAAAPEAENALQHGLTENILNATRLALLSSARSVPLRDLLRSISSFSYKGDWRNLFIDESKKARGLVSADLLSFVHLYVPLLPGLRKAWKLKLDEGDDDILKGRYIPDQFRSAAAERNGTQGTSSVGGSGVNPADFQLQFDLVFKKAENEKLLLDIIDKTKTPLHKYVTENLEARLSSPGGGLSPSMSQQPGPELLEALKVLSSDEFVLKQSFSSEAHCSLFHALPDNLQRHAISESARARLIRILSPFNLLNSERDRDILGGPLPWERRCVESALRRIVRRSSIRALVKAAPLTGPKRAGMYGLQKWIGHTYV